jgi:hypothetical protein
MKVEAVLMQRSGEKDGSEKEVVMSVMVTEKTLDAVLKYCRKTENNNIMDMLQEGGGKAVALQLHRPPRIRWGLRREMYGSMYVLWHVIDAALSRKMKGEWGKVSKEDGVFLEQVLCDWKSYEFVRNFCMMLLLFDIIGVCVTKLQEREEMNVFKARKILREMVRKSGGMVEEESVYRLMLDFCRDHKIDINVPAQKDNVNSTTRTFVEAWLRCYAVRFPSDPELDLMERLLSPRWILSLADPTSYEGCEDWERLCMKYK